MAVVRVSACVLFAGLAPALKLEGAVCDGVHCFGSSAYCCTDDLGRQSCCYESLIEEAWFWSLVVIGMLLLGSALFFCCRAVYRYHNAGQYTKLRQQQPENYGSIPSPVHTIHMPPPPVSSSDSLGQLPSYATVMGGPPPAYNESEEER